MNWTTFKKIAVFFALSVFCFFGGMLCGAFAQETLPAAADPSGRVCTLHFNERAAAGKVYSFSGNISRNESWKMNIPGVRMPVFRQDTFRAETSGILSVLESSPDRILLEYEVGFLSGSVNGLPVNTQHLKGKKVSILLEKGSQTQVSVPDSGKNLEITPVTSYSQVLGPSSTPSKELSLVKYADMTAESLLAVFFTFPQDSLSEYLGENPQASPGQDLKLNLDPVRKHIAGKGFQLMSNSLSGKAKLLRPKNFRGQTALPLQMDLSSDGIPGYDFTYSLRMFLPENSQKNAIPLMVHQTAVEIADRVVPDIFIWYAGENFQFVRNCDLSFICLPWEKL